jgi:hypothetical protein
MRDPDRTIENLLAGLRDAEPPPGMHHRILDAMAAGPATAYGSRRRLYLAIAISLACALAITIWVQYPRHIPANLGNYTTNVEAPRTKPAQTVADKTPREPRRPTSKVLLRPIHAGEVSYAEQSPGFPAPPLPLTEQEKLLLRLAHRNDAQDMTLLNPDVQAQQSAKATQQFQQFFGMDTNEMRSESE